MQHNFPLKIKPYLEIEYWLLVGVEVCLAVLVGEQALQLGERDGLRRAAASAGRRVARFPDLAELDPQVVVERGGDLGVLVGRVAGAQDTVDGALEGVA